MVGLGSTVADLVRLKRQHLPYGRNDCASRLSDAAFHGSNPGNLRAKIFLPTNLPEGSPLVVVLHGCTQTAAAYDTGAGWSQLADEFGFALLFPEQQRSNNPNLCFNWFSPPDMRRGGGEALSIRQMIEMMVATYGIDPRRIFVTGLSAGGAMTSVMLATYPEIFAAGAIIAGLAFSTTSSVGDALGRMRGQGFPTDAQLGELVRGTSDHQGPWPRVSVWQGSADHTVDRSNAERITGQWRAVHGMTALTKSTQTRVAGYQRDAWHDDTGRTVIESFEITGLGHGTPLKTSGPDACGVAGPHMLEAGISSTRHIARFWGLSAQDLASPNPAPTLSETLTPVGLTVADVDRPLVAQSPSQQATGVRAIIEDALRVAGLLR
jgi:poly(hydroxyalkanoate) depolymerase family esterase